MFHTLLVAIDGGPQTRRIAELARQAAAPGARVHLLCAVDAGYALPGRPTLLDYPPAAHECEEARQVLDEACALLAGCELEVRAELRAGDPVQVILGEARRLGCELIVIGHRHLGRLRLQAGEQILVPLCGKTLDLAWLAAQGLEVLGVELSEKAVSDFFEEHDLRPEIDQLDGFRRYRVAGITLLQGDFFALQAEHLAQCRAFYDRAALIALPPEMRERYAGHLQAVLPTRSLGLLVTIDYPQAEMAGPPFAVPDEEVRGYYAGGWRIEELERGDVLGVNWKFLERGVSWLDEAVYLLERG
ncbi:thiopurine S-methyltransferase [Pseudomonas aeruginosa]|uniref:thiopurine S-methyltransferase n=8 Tax=Bacteria TaxID=2 RepID=UPI0022376776|nr:thiopurine S-methyltransferase [Pseudomonas aeruginosa]